MCSATKIQRLLIKKGSPENFGFKAKHSLEFSLKGRLFTTPGSRGYFFLIDTDVSRRNRVNEEQSGREKRARKNVQLILQHCS